MQQHRHPACDLLTDVITGECTPAEREAFMSHLDACPSCSEQYTSLSSIWDGLYLAQEEHEPPISMKKEVLGSIFNKENPKPTIAITRIPKPRMWMAAAVVLVLFTAINGVLFYESRQSELPALNQPAKVVQFYRLTASAEAEEGSSGVACIVERNGKQELIVYGYGLPETEGDQAYQVWLLRDGVRTNAGTFHVGKEEEGLGVLTLPLDESVQFDALGITLEPDANGDEPRGKKILGS